MERQPKYGDRNLTRQLRPAYDRHAYQTRRQLLCLFSRIGGTRTPTQLHYSFPGIPYNTIKKALRRLEDEGILDSYKGRYCLKDKTAHHYFPEYVI